MDGIPDLGKLGAMEISMPRPIVLRLPTVQIKMNMHKDGSETQIQFITDNPVLPLAIEIPFPPVYLRTLITNLETLYERAIDAQAAT